MEIRIASEDGAGLEVAATIVAEEPRGTVPLLDPDLPRSQDLLSMCSWCRRVLIHSDQWLDLERAIEELQLFSHKVLPQLSHSACPDCYARIMSAEGLDLA
jgi:hypothetical protein